MPDHMEPERLYREAQSALKSRDYVRASDLLKKILVIDENYKDASRLLARIVKEKRRRWYNDVRIWGTLGALLLVGLGFFIAPKLSNFFVVQIATPVIKATTTPSPTVTAVPTQTPLPTPTPAPLTWKRIYGGDVFSRAIITAIVVDPRDADVIYIGTESAGIYKSIDGGMSWKPAHQGLLLANVDTLVIDPNNPRILYAGIISAGVYKTTDGGENWQVNIEDLNGSVSKIVIDQNDSSHLYYTQGLKIYQSKDGGETWVSINISGFSSDIISFVMNLTDPKTLFMAERDVCGVYISHDEGVSWMFPSTIQKQTTNDHIGELKINGKTSYLIMVNTHAAGEDTPSVYSSSDEGKTWNWRSRINCNTLTIHPDGKTIFCGATDGTVYKSTDIAQTWSLLAVLPIGQVRVITVSPHDSKVLLAGGEGLYISLDGGQKWEERSNGLGRGGTELEIDPSDNTKFYGVEAGGSRGEVIYRSLDQGLSWKLRSKHCQLVFGTAGNLVCNHLENTKPAESYLETDGLGGCGRGGFAAVNPYRQGEFYLAGRDNCVGIKISLDSGKSWNNTNISEELSEARFYFATDQKTIYAASIHGWSPPHILRSTDGTNWESCGEEIDSISSAASRFAIDPNNSAIVYLATRGNGVYTSQDGCKSWQASKAGLDNQFINTVATDARNSSLVYAGTDSGAYISTDGGEIWGQINDGLLGATVVYSIVVDKDSTVYATTPYGIFKLESK